VVGGGARQQLLDVVAVGVVHLIGG
jgi:hypothetical protein